MIGAATARGRGPATDAFWTVVTRTAVREASAAAGLRAVRTGRFAAAVLCVALTRRCLRFTGTVPVKPNAAKRWRPKMKVMIRGDVARDNLIIEMLPLHLIGENGEDCWPEWVTQHSTGASEYSILYTGTWPRQANSIFILPFRSSLLEVLNQEIISCGRCPRLRQHSAEVAQLKRRAYRDQTYWGLPVPSFRDPGAHVLILGLAPGAHGSNRTGRMFTGDRSGDILYKVLHKTGFASRPTSVSREDGLTLHDLYITAAAHCAPPGNNPTPQELRSCRPYFERELALLPNPKA